MMEGDVSTIDLLARLVELGREKFTGAIRFENEGIIKILYLKGGDILSASTNDRADSVDELLLRAGKVTREHVKQALAKRKENETLGDALLNLGFITRKELTWGRRVQVISVIRSVRSWKTGTYTIVADYLPKREEGTLFALQQVIVELIVTEQDRSEVERAMEGGQAVFRKAGDFDEHYRTLGLNEDADAVVAEVDGQRTASEVASLAGRDAFNVYKLLRAFAILGLTERVGAPAPAMQSAATSGTDDLLSTGFSSSPQPSWSSPPSAATVAVPMPVSSPVEEFGDAPTLEIPMKESLPPDLPVPKTASRPAPPARIATPPPRKMPTQARSSRPVLSAPRKEKKSSASLLVILLLLLLGAGGWYGWQWWQARTPSPKPALVAAKPKPSEPVVPATTTVAATTSSAPVTTTTQAPVAMTPKPAPPAQKPVEAPKPAPVVPKPAPVMPKPAASTDRYADMAREYERTANGTYTVQFELVCQSSSLAKAIEAGGQKIWFVPIAYKGQSCYRVFWGRFATREAAALAVPSIPRALRGPAPAIVRVQ